jgi:uncharacterized membrane protein
MKESLLRKMFNLAAELSELAEREQQIREELAELQKQADLEEDD